MNVFVFYRHYWPDTTPYGVMLKQILERLAADGHRVTVFTAQPSYNDVRQSRAPWIEMLNGVRVVRMPLAWERKSVLPTRVLNSVLFSAGALVFGLLQPNIGLAMTHSAPPVLMGGTALLLSVLRRVPYLYHCQDLNPEAIIYGGKLEDGLFSRAMLEVEKRVQASAGAVVVLSKDMVETIRSRGLPASNVRVINNFALTEGGAENEIPSSLEKRPGEYRVLFAGNHGAFQGLQHVIDAAWLLREYNQIHFQFVGEGAVKKDLVQQAGELVDRTIHFHPYVPVGMAFAVMQQAELGLVTLARDVYKVAFPSKTMTLLTAGVPLLVAVEPESELARFVGENEVGWVCGPDDPQGLANAIRQGFENRGQIDAMRERCRKVAEASFGLRTNLDRWSQLISELGKAV